MSAETLCLETLPPAEFEAESEHRSPSLQIVALPGRTSRASYLRRIDVSGDLEVNASTLQRLHRQHLFHVPFENLDIHLGRPLSLEFPALYEKIVTRRRGGFCYELNGLFAWLLRDLGFEVHLLEARFLERGALGPRFDHMALLVGAGRPWLVDVGFGESFINPLPLDSEETHDEGGVAYRIVAAGDERSALERRPRGGDWQVQYLFEKRPHELPEFADRCVYHQTSSESHFTQKRLCTMATADGRITLSNLRLIETKADQRSERQLVDDGEWHSTLQALFGVDLAIERRDP